MTTTTSAATALEEQIHEAPGRFRVLTGDRPTGRLHLGHYLGTLHNRIRLQNLGAPMYILIADYQVLTDRHSAGGTATNVEEILLDHLAAESDPERARSSRTAPYPALNQLRLPFLSLVAVAELRRNPTVKDEIAHARQDAVSGLMFTYPAHQAGPPCRVRARPRPPPPRPPRRQRTRQRPRQRHPQRGPHRHGPRLPPTGIGLARPNARGTGRGCGAQSTTGVPSAAVRVA